MYRSFACKPAQGESHRRDGKPCQDWAAASGTGGFCVAAVADGHGGEKYFRSGTGARIACHESIQCALKCILTEEFTQAMRDPHCSDALRERMLGQLEESIILAWGEAVRRHLVHKPFSDDELLAVREERRGQMADFEHAVTAYGATLLLAVLCDGFWFGLHIGDGALVALPEDGEPYRPIEPDERCVGNYVTSLCDKNAIRYFHHAWGAWPPAALLLVTDGVEESFASYDALYGFCRRIADDARQDFDGTISDLENYLPTLSQKGSRDDMAVAGILLVPDTMPETGPQPGDGTVGR